MQLKPNTSWPVSPRFSEGATTAPGLESTPPIPPAPRLSPKFQREAA